MLTDQKIYDLWNANPECFVNDAGVLQLGRAIEAEALQSRHSQNVIHAPQAQEPVAFPIPPAGIIAHPNLGELYDRLQMQQYAMKYAMLYASQQPPSSCPNCLGQEPDDLRLRDEYMKAEREIIRLQAKLAELEKDQSQYCPDCEARANGEAVLVPSVQLKKLQANVAEQSVEIARQNKAYESLDEQRNRDFETIAQQASCIAELEETRDALWETQKALCNQINDRDKLIGQCEKALAKHGAAYLGHQEEYDAALAAIAEHKKGNQ